MSIRPGLVTYLNTKTGLTDLVGSRIGFLRAAHDDSLPYVIIQQISGDHKQHMTAATGKVVGRFQFDCYGATLLSATAVAEQLRLALDGYRGAMGSAFVSCCHLEDERDQFDVPTGGEEDGITSVQQDYIIAWTVSVPSFA